MRAFAANWHILGDALSADIISQGYRIPLTSDPPLTIEPVEVRSAPELQRTLAEQVSSLCLKNAIELLPEENIEPGYYSPIFLVPKKNSDKWRMIHNLKRFNKRHMAPPPKFRLLTVSNLLHIIDPGDYLVSLDLSDAYLHVPIHPDHRKYLRFIFQGKHYQWKVLPFGISTAPWLFTRVTKPLVAYLHSRGINFHMYLDDCLITHRDPVVLKLHLDFALRVLGQLGWLVNLEKSDLTPSRDMIYLGIWFQTDLALATITPQRQARILALAGQGLVSSLTVHQWQVLLGHLTSAQDLTIRGRLLLRPLQMYLIPLLDRHSDRRIHLSTYLKGLLKWWTVKSNVTGGHSLLPFRPTLQLFADASTQGWGAHLQGHTVAGVWAPLDRERHINHLEFKAIILAVQHWSHRLSHQRLMINTDNSTVVHFINKQGSTRSQDLLGLTFEFFQTIDNIDDLQIRVRHIPGARNVIADALSRPGKPSPTEWQLRPQVFRELVLPLAYPNIDLFATSFNKQLQVYMSPIPDPGALASDALSQSWEGLNAYAYPPPAILPLVLQKVRATQRLTLTLVAPYWPSRCWFPSLVRLAGRPKVRLSGELNLLVHPHSRQGHPNLQNLNLHVWVVYKNL